MFTVIFTFLKSKLFSTAGLFILSFAVIIGSFIFYNSDTILDKFGFETKATLKSELSKSQKDIETAVTVNKNLNKTIDQIQEGKIKTVEVLETYSVEKAKVQKKVKTITAKRYKEIEIVQEKIEQKVVVTDTTITIPIKEANDASKLNIIALNEVFASLELSPINPVEKV